MNLNDLLAPILPDLSYIIYDIFGLLLLWIGWIFKEKTGVDIEAKLRQIELDHRDSLKSAVQTALGAAIQKFSGAPIVTGSPVMTFILNTVKDHAPDAIWALNVTDQSIENLALRYLTQLQATKNSNTTEPTT